MKTWGRANAIVKNRTQPIEVKFGTSMGCCICCTEAISSLSSATQSHRAFASMLEPGQCREKERGSEICQNLRKVVASYPVIQNLCIFETHLEFLHAKLLRRRCRSEGAPCVFIDQRTVVCAIVVVYVVSQVPPIDHLAAVWQPCTQPSYRNCW